MSDVVIRAEGLGKKYVIGHQGESERYTSLRDVLARGARGLIRSARDRVGGKIASCGDETAKDFWALKDVKFEIKRGEVVGIIGRNGAGKSTLLKILSRITEPTEGTVEIRGRVASLLEVGTGFHPELTGRENIYLNGAILGMSRTEIRRKFDEIVAFAEVERFLDTPVKRYSSGMYVRLAFAVAAHLEPEILVVDEVLAVGDVEFQKKCLGKMNEVAGQGRTVLFVSHNMAAVQALCIKAFEFSKGQLINSGLVREVMQDYLMRALNSQAGLDNLSSLRYTGEGSLTIKRLKIKTGNGKEVSQLTTGEACTFELELTGIAKPGNVRIGISFNDMMGVPLLLLASDTAHHEAIEVGSGSIIQCTVRKFPLPAATYQVTLFLELSGTIQHWIIDEIQLSVLEGSFFGTQNNLPLGWEGKTVLVENSWKLIS